jgi:tRNA 2-thiouridine synthesizing protein A
MEFDHALDVCGLCCAEPIVRITKTFKGLDAGAVLMVTTDKASMLKDVPAYCKQTGHELIHQQASQGKLRFWMRKHA